MTLPKPANIITTYPIPEADNRVRVVMDLHDYRFYVGVERLINDRWEHIPGSAAGISGAIAARDQAERLFDGGWKQHVRAEPPPRPLRDFLVGNPERIALLGTTTDTALAKAWKVSVPRVHQARVRRNIPAYRNPEHAPHNPDLLALLGTMTDRALGARFGVSRQRLCQLREVRGIPAYRTKEADKLDAEMEPLLGSMSDRDIARRLGVNAQTVLVRRNARGIPAYADRLKAPRLRLREKASKGRECYELAAAAAAAGHKPDWLVIGETTGTKEPHHSARQYAKVRGLTWPLKPT